MGVNYTELEQLLERVLRHDLSIGTEAFRDALLARCISVIDADLVPVELDDSDLSLLAAAGDAALTTPPRAGNSTIQEG